MEDTKRLIEVISKDIKNDLDDLVRANNSLDIDPNNIIDLRYMYDIKKEMNERITALNVILSYLH